MQRRYLGHIVLPLALLCAAPALAQTGVDVSWAALDPGDDWAARIIRSVFPINGTPADAGTGNAATIIGQLVRFLTGFVAAMAMAYLCYSMIMQMWRGAETSRLMSDGMSGMFAVRLGVAAIFMFPLPSGFSTGQTAVVQGAMWGIGMARMVYASAVQGIGADARVIAEPIIPGTRTIVTGLIRNEFCRAMVNLASNNPNLVPAPAPVSTRSPLARAGGQTAFETWNYRLSSGNETGAPVCGSVSLRAAGGTSTVAGVNVDQAGKQREILTSVLTNSIRPDVEQVAQKLYTTRRADELQPLMNIMVAATADYTTRLTAASTEVMSNIRNALADSRGSGASADASQIRLVSLGWTSAGAYYLEFSRLNGATMSLLSAVPQVTRPSGLGLGPALTSDLTPYSIATEAFMERLTAYVDTTDQANTPIGGAGLFAGGSPAEGDAGLVERVLRGLNLGENVLGLITNYLLAPGQNVWTDPFGSLMQLGHAMVGAGMGALGAAGVAVASSTAAATAANSNFLTGMLVGWAPAGIAKTLEFFSPAIFSLAAALLIPGLTIAFVLPMIPWLIWMAGVAGWLILVCEAVIAVPLWMLAHMTMRGEGLHGKAAEGYALLFNVIFRPVLMLIGLFLGYFIFASMSWLLRQSFGVAAGFVLGNGWMVTNMLGILVLMSIFVLTHVVLASMSFRMISLVPHHVVRMIGFAPANRVDMDQFSRDAALVGTAGALKAVDGAVADTANGSPARSAAERDSGRPGSGRRRSDGLDSTLGIATDSQRPRDNG